MVDVWIAGQTLRAVLASVTRPSVTRGTQDCNTQCVLYFPVTAGVMQRVADHRGGAEPFSVGDARRRLWASVQ
jgi:hypothetical protein